MRRNQPLPIEKNAAYTRPKLCRMIINVLYVPSVFSYCILTERGMYASMIPYNIESVFFLLIEKINIFFSFLLQDDWQTKIK